MNSITKTLLISSITNIFLLIIKIVFGLIGRCSALVADGVHSLSDLLTDFIAIVGNKLSLKPADNKHPFGHGKIEYLTSLIIGIIIVILGFSLIYNSFNQEYIIPNFLVIVISVVTIIAKYILSNYIYKNGIKYNNSILISSAKESKSDVLSSILVLITTILMQFSSSFTPLKYADKIGTIIISLFIILTGYIVLKENISNILDEQITDKDYINKLKDIIISFDEIISIDSLYVLKNGPYYKLMSNVIMKEGITLNLAHEVIDEIEDKIKKNDDRIKYVFIHMEPKEKIN